MSFLYATKNCPFCEEDIDLTDIGFHVPQCYREWCINRGVVPLCTCNNCKATKAHDHDTLHGQDARDIPTRIEELVSKNIIICYILIFKLI